MAKKGGAQKLQEEISSDEELERFLDRPGLLVLDVYSEWCGPCLGMVGTLKKIKLESGGDSLSLAICKCDNIEALKRFRRKSEPTWLFVTNGKAINIMFGSDAPKLLSLIQAELNDLVNKKRDFYDISEYQPVEEIVRQAKENVIRATERQQFEAKEKKRLDYLNQVTDIIMANLSDMGVTIFGPQVNRDVLKKLIETAENLKIQCKDRKFLQLAAEKFETIHFDCPNPLEEDVLQRLDGKELLVCLWKLPGEDKDIPKLLNNYANELMMSHTQQTDDVIEEEIVLPPILKPMEVKVEVELQEGDIWIEPDDTSSEENLNAKEITETENDEGENELEESAEEEVHEVLVGEAEKHFTALDLDLDDTPQKALVEEEEPIQITAVPKKQIRLKKVRIPPIWVANNHRTHAALTYVLFRNQTQSFLPPDPVPEPPHVIMAFETSKKRDLIAHAELHKVEVPLYGFFTSDDAKTAEFISNSLEKYKIQTANDKIVFKIHKATSHTMLSFMIYEPTYVSPNVDVGQEEAKKFFPESYKTVEQEREEEAKASADEPTKKKKKSLVLKEVESDHGSMELSTEDGIQAEVIVDEENVKEISKTEVTTESAPAA
uniref:DUF4746 domain-containing protein n=1 Tax=Stomoxys calcitrans TaxID=35570 RepID=A0A1I8PLU9_STOCA